MDQRIHVKPLQPHIGAEISGGDLPRPIFDAVRDKIKNVLQHGKELIPLMQEAVANRPARDIAA